MIHPFCSALQARRRPVPVNTSSRRTGSGLDLGKSSVSDTCLTRSIQRADIRPSAPDVKRGSEDRLRSGWRATRQAYGEHRPFAGLALDGHVATHHARELAGDGKAEPRAAEV